MNSKIFSSIKYRSETVGYTHQSSFFEFGKNVHRVEVKHILCAPSTPIPLKHIFRKEKGRFFFRPSLQLLKFVRNWGTNNRLG